MVWLTIVNIEDPYISKTFYDVPVEKVNVEAIESEKLAIEYKEGETVNIRIRGKRSIIDDLSVNELYAYADLEKKSITDAVDIVLEVPDSVTVLEKSPNMMMVELENIITVQKEVQPYMEGEPSEGYVYLDSIVNPNNIEVEGPESKVNMIKSVLVPVSIEGVTRDVTIYRTPQILDESNKVINGLTVNVGQVEIQVPIEKLTTAELKLDLEEIAADGYELIDVSISQNTLQVRGKESLINTIDTLTISGINLSAYTEDTTVNIETSAIVTEGLTVYDDVNSIQLYVDVEPIEEKVIEVTHGDINVRSLADGLTFSFVDDDAYSIVYKGIEASLEGINLASISPSISLLGLEEGIHKVDITYNVPRGTEVVSAPITIRVELSAEEVVEEEPTGEIPPPDGNTVPGLNPPPEPVTDVPEG